MRAWYATKADAKRFLIVNILIHVASSRQPTMDPGWVTYKLSEEMRDEFNNDFCVLYDNGGGNRNDTIFGVLFFLVDYRISSVPNVINNYNGGWTEFLLRH